jgi:hypothetical protein
VWGLRQNSATWTRTEYLDTDLNLSAFGEDEAGGLYVLHYGGQLYKIVDTSTPATFNDVPVTHWAWSHIEGLYDAGVTTGCPYPNFCPSITAARDQMAVFLLRAKYGLPYTQNLPPAVGLFSDVPSTYWAAREIEKAYNDGIVTACGTAPLRFCPSASLPRALMAQWLLLGRYGSTYTPPPASSQIFNDVPVSHPYVAWIHQLYAEGITTGCPYPNFCPDTSVSRDQTAVFLVRNFNLPRP